MSAIEVCVCVQLTHPLFQQWRQQSQWSAELHRAEHAKLLTCPSVRQRELAALQTVENGGLATCAPLQGARCALFTRRMAGIDPGVYRRPVADDEAGM